MRISKTKNNKKYFITIVVILIVLAGAYTGAAAIYHFWPFSTPSAPTHHSDQPNSKDNTTEKSSDTPSNPSNNTSKDKSTQNTTQSNPNYVDTPITNQPTNNDPYPITNEHYRIEQKSPTSYSVTLYPIVNNPEYSDYNAQLKAYKTEALDYLKGRYGNIDSYNFEWSPSNAASL